jgi:uncharacterized membrane protein YphA (DoxX/SURF4 family)
MFEDLNIPVIIVLIFHSIVFLQSGIDKVTNWKGNLEFTTQTLSEKFPKPMVVFALLSVLLFEAFGGLFSIISVVMNLIGIYYLIYAQIGLLMCGIALLILMLGQRLSQNYVDAKTIAIYFIVCMGGLILVFN